MRQFKNFEYKRSLKKQVINFKSENELKIKFFDLRAFQKKAKAIT